MHGQRLNHCLAAGLLAARWD